MCALHYWTSMFAHAAFNPAYWSLCGVRFGYLLCSILVETWVLCLHLGSLSSPACTLPAIHARPLQDQVQSSCHIALLCCVLSGSWTVMLVCTACSAWEAVRHAKRPRVHTLIATSDIHMIHKLRMSRDEVSSNSNMS